MLTYIEDGWKVEWYLEKYNLKIENDIMTGKIENFYPISEYADQYEIDLHRLVNAYKFSNYNNLQFSMYIGNLHDDTIESLLYYGFYTNALGLLIIDTDVNKSLSDFIDVKDLDKLDSDALTVVKRLSLHWPEEKVDASILTKIKQYIKGSIC